MVKLKSLVFLLGLVLILPACPAYVVPGGAYTGYYPYYSSYYSYPYSYYPYYRYPESYFYYRYPRPYGYRRFYPEGRFKGRGTVNRSPRDRPGYRGGPGRGGFGGQGGHR
uniref:Uncharacterized protein n=1 Tax=Desulfobacca acetoxidans TaxID=60893 RepID=A0A7C3YZK9_9BACT